MTTMQGSRYGDPDNVEVIELTPEEYDQAVQNSLDDIGLTFEELAEQARSGDFVSLRARHLWLMIKPSDYHGR